MTDRKADKTTAALAMAADADYEAMHGLSFVSINALLMRRYMHEFNVPHDAFAPFTVNAHRNAVHNPYAMFPFPVSKEAFRRAKMIADPINLMDSSPICDGAAALMLCPTDMARDLREARPVRVLASTAATDAVALHDRRDPLVLEGVALSAHKAYRQAGVQPADVDLFELHDAFSIMSVLSLEACGFAERGQGVRLGLDGKIGIDGQLPICTMGGLKARGHPVGATGIYQLVEAVQQLRGEAGDNQVADARLAMTQNIGGSGATVVTHILETIV
jgi:acetyl-CoA C-acetyltransferase